MEAQELASRLEGVQSPDEARELLAANRKARGFSRAFLNRTLELYGADPGAFGRYARHAREVVRYGDDRASGYRALGVFEHYYGRYRESANAFIRSGDTATTPRDRLANATGAVDALSRAGRPLEALALAEQIQRGLTELGEPALAARVRVNAANAYIEQDRYREALRTLKGLPEYLHQEGFLYESINARLALSSAHLFGGDPEAARTEAQAVLEAAEANNLPLQQRQARMTIAYVALLRGRCDETLAALLSLREEAQEDVPDQAQVLEFLGDAYARLNLWPEAIDAYRTALSRPGLSLLRRGHVGLGLGQALLGHGDFAEGLAEIREASNRYRKLGNGSWEAASTISEADALRLLGRKTASRRAQEATGLARRNDSPYHVARALLTQAQCCDDVAALDEASRLVRKFGFGGLEWRVYAERARLDRRRALAHYRKMLDAILRERTLATSTASRASYLRDKGDALRDYLELLLERPTSERVAEAVSVIDRSRSVALLDEIMSARGDAFGADVLEQLGTLRRELEGEMDSDRTGDGARAIVDRTTDLSGFQRRWLERTHRLVTQLETPAVVRKPDTAAFVTTRKGIHVLANGHAWRLPLTPDELAERLKWLQFELLEPMVDRNVDPKAAFESLKSLSRELLLPWAAESSVGGLTPDGILWRIPWLACCEIMGTAPLELRLHPGLGGSPAKLPERPLAALWVAEHADLRFANREANAFLEVFPDAVVARSATEAREMLGGRFDVLHVVAHARHRWTNPMFSAIEFRDGSVFASEVAQSSLHVGFVMLSACDTGSMSLTCQDEPDGFARAFLGRGAHSVIGSAWPLDDEAGSRLSQSFYAEFISGQDVLHSLRRAQEKVREWRAHPYFWAPHLLYGGYNQ
jgi:tetratricopeptide (TPR) repeat protein